MRQKVNFKKDELGRPYIEPQPPRILTPEEVIKRDLVAKQFDEEFKAAFKDGLDLSNYNSR